MLKNSAKGAFEEEILRIRALCYPLGTLYCVIAHQKTYAQSKGEKQIMPQKIAPHPPPPPPQ